MLKKITIYLCLFSAVFFAGYYCRNITKESDPTKLIFTRSQQKINKLTNPLLDCELNNSMSLVPVNSIQRKVSEIIEENVLINETSVYFRDLNNGGSFGINENIKFAPASLLKLPIMIAYLKLAETTPDLLEKKLIYVGGQITLNNAKNIDALVIGKEYSVDDLIFRMISLSDNDAFELLFKNIDPTSIKKIYTELDIIYPDNTNIDDYITAKSYAGLFRILFNSTYLSREMSEKALNYLTKSDFHSGIQAGIPGNIKTALKFGVREINQNGYVQLHDCGIVYKPKKPYLLCIMTRGKDYKYLAGIIQKISQIVYTNLN
jgi:beta-lactamase class A